MAILHQIPANFLGAQMFSFSSFSPYPFAFCPLLLIIVASNFPLLPILGQTIANIPDLDTQQPNFYRWMEQNAYICENSLTDAPQFVSEADADQFHCTALCGDPLDIPHLACAKRANQRPHEWPQCHPVPPLCVLNFVQEFLALRIHRGEFSIDHLTAATPRSNNQLQFFTQSPQQTTPIPPIFASTTPPPQNDQDGSVEADFERRKSSTFANGFPLTQVDGETNNRKEQPRKSSGEGQSAEAELSLRNTKKKHLTAVDRKANSLEFKKDSPTLTLFAPKKLAINLPNKKNRCRPDVDPESCRFWAQTGECNANPAYMLRECQRACGLCGNDGTEEFRS